MPCFLGNIVDVVFVENSWKHAMFHHALNESDAVMKSVPHQLAFSLLIGLCGCSLLNGNSGGEGGSDTAGGVLPSADRPPLMRLGDSRVGASSLKVIQACEQRLGLAAEDVQLAHPTNFGERKSRDSWGRELQVKPMVIVLHETVINEPQALGLFKTNHPDDDQQVSYHMIIGRDGRRVRIVPDQKRAYGSGMSAFGDVTMRDRPGSVGSINNIALHISLVTPSDGRGDADGHSGYTNAQYKSLAQQVLLWQATFGIPITRLTTHAAVDRSRSRYDPRSFRWDRFDAHYNDAAELCGLNQFNNEQAGP
ncbi:N-acetyl-anhydromuranmyl-L-alanine amidase [Synechococcus sp. MIT S9504]|nr:N-acetyl-anhydromuranmyl-L-alanine amidase [Synechococcus sp. MIT S9504]